MAAAREVCGLRLWDRTEETRAGSVLRGWRKAGVELERIWAMIHGARILVDAGKVSWLKSRQPFGLRALNKTGVLFDQGDGKAARSFFDVAAEAYQQHHEKRDRRARGDLGRVSAAVPEQQRETA